MTQKERDRISTIKVKTIALRPIICFMVVATFVFPALPNVKAQSRYIASPSYWFRDRASFKDKLGPDYVVEFEIPLDATNIWALPQPPA
jgi:hypothetical protein